MHEHFPQSRADRWLADYFATYVQRDVRDLLNVGNLMAFTGFMRLAAEMLKREAHAGRSARLFHYRESRGLEIDLLLETGGQRLAIEAKSGATVAGDFFAPLEKLRAAMPDTRAGIVFGGDTAMHRHGMRAVSWDRLNTLLENP